jgi:hypothetical protein
MGENEVVDSRCPFVRPGLPLRPYLRFSETEF